MVSNATTIALKWEHVSSGILLWIYLFPFKLHLIIVWYWYLVYNCSLRLLAAIERGGDWPQRRFAVYYFICFVLIPSRRIIAFWNHIPLFICSLTLAPSLSTPRSLVHVPISTSLCIHDERKWKRLHFGRMSLVRHNLVWKPEPTRATNQAADCRWVAFEKPQKSCAHHNVLTVF